MLFTFNEITAALLNDEKFYRKELNISSRGHNVLATLQNSVSFFSHHSIANAVLWDGGGVELLQLLNKDRSKLCFFLSHSETPFFCVSVLHSASAFQ